MITLVQVRALGNAHSPREDVLKIRARSSQNLAKALPVPRTDQGFSDFRSDAGPALKSTPLTAAKTCAPLRSYTMTLFFEEGTKRTNLLKPHWPWFL